MFVAQKVVKIVVIFYARLTNHFSKRKSKQNTHLENLMPITNSGEFYTYPEEHRGWRYPVGWGGVCNAHSTIRRRIASLAIFPNGSSSLASLSEKDRNDYYEKILKDLLSGKVREIPGYSNIFDFYLGHFI